MAQLQIIIRDENQEQEFALSVARKAIDMYKKESKDLIDESERTILGDLLKDRFSNYNTRHYKDQIKEAIKNGELGDFDRFNNFVASYSEIKKFIFNK